MLQILGDSRSDGGPTRCLSTSGHTSPALSRGVFGTTVGGQEVGDRGDYGWTFWGLSSDRVLLGELVLLVLVEFIDRGRGELARRNLLGKKNVEFVEGSILFYHR